MFDKVATPRVDIYDGKTNEFYGRATFPVTQNVEDSLLQIINNAGKPELIILQDVTFFPASSDYDPPGLFEKESRNGIIRAEFRDADSHLWMLADIFISLDSQVRGNLSGDKYHFDSVAYSNIVVQDVRIFPQGPPGVT